MIQCKNKCTWKARYPGVCFVIRAHAHAHMLFVSNSIISKSISYQPLWVCWLSQYTQLSPLNSSPTSTQHYHYFCQLSALVIPVHLSLPLSSYQGTSLDTDHYFCQLSVLVIPVHLSLPLRSYQGAHFNFNFDGWFYARQGRLQGHKGQTQTTRHRLATTSLYNDCQVSIVLYFTQWKLIFYM